MLHNFVTSNARNDCNFYKMICNRKLVEMAERDTSGVDEVGIKDFQKILDSFSAEDYGLRDGHDWDLRLRRF